MRALDIRVTKTRDGWKATCRPKRGVVLACDTPRGAVEAQESLRRRVQTWQACVALVEADEDLFADTFTLTTLLCFNLTDDRYASRRHTKGGDKMRLLAKGRRFAKYGDRKVTT